MLSGCQPGITKAAGILRDPPWRRGHCCRLRCRDPLPPQLATDAALWFSHSMFMGFYLLSFLLERKPCTICALVFLAALFLICYSCWGNCFLYHCSDSPLPESAHDPGVVGT